MKHMSGLFLLVMLVSCGKEETLVPSDIVNDFLQGYSNQERQAIQMDHQHIEDLCLAHKKPSPENKRVYVATVGAPGTSKSTILETYLADHPDLNELCVYIDPDQRALKFMTATYWQSMACYQVSKSPSYQDCAGQAYGKWRGASNYIANSLLNKVYQEGFSIAHGTTSQSPQVVNLYKKLHAKGYKIVLLMCMSSSDNRLQAVKNREEKQGFVQSTQKDFVEKEKAILKNMPLYFQHADVIHVYWTERFDKGAVEVGVFTKENGWVANPKNQEWMKKIKAAYDVNKSADMPDFDALTKRVG